jgi:hypothetical protein
MSPKNRRMRQTGAGSVLGDCLSSMFARQCYRTIIREDGLSFKTLCSRGAPAFKKVSCRIRKLNLPTI